MLRHSIVSSALIVCAVILPSRSGSAEPMFLSKNEARCTTCHHSPTGGGLLTAYGRLMSKQELSTTSGGESENFLWGAFGDKLGPVDLGIDLRPSHLRYSFSGFSFDVPSQNRRILMNADVIGAVQARGWTLYGEIGRRPEGVGGDLYSYEHWVGKQLANGWSIRAGRFLPAYGVRFADHTSFNREPLGLNIYDQLYAAEVSHTTPRRLVQIAVGPGRAEEFLNDQLENAFSTSGRVQFDVNARNVLVLSGIFRAASDTSVRNGAAGIAYGFSPASRVTIWTQADALLRDDFDGNSMALVNETAVEAVRGLWLKFSPQLLTEAGTRPSTFRVKLEAAFLPRTHWNVNVAYYRDRQKPVTAHIFLTQLHLYL